MSVGIFVASKVPATDCASAACAVLLCCITACGSSQRPEQPDPAIGSIAALVLPSADGDVVDLARFRGHRLVLHVASTSSLDAQSDVEELRRTRTSVPDVTLAELVFDENARRLAVPWADASAIDWSVLLPTTEVRSGESPLGPIKVIPTTFVIDESGRIVWRWEGALPRGRLTVFLSGATRL